MGFIKVALPFLSTLNTVFKEGLTIAKTLAQICAAGIVATGILIGELTGLLKDAELDLEPP